jgi:hypothetical protein
MQMQQIEPTPLLCDNQGVIKLAKNPIIHERTKHVDVHCHFIRELVEDGFIKLRYYQIEDETDVHCHFIKELVEDGFIKLRYYQTEDETVEILTKTLGPERYVKFHDKLGVVSRLTIKGGSQSNY